MKTMFLPNKYDQKNASPTKRAGSNTWRQRWALRLRALALWLADEDFYRERQRVLHTTAAYHDAVLGVTVARAALKSARQRQVTAKQALAEQLAGKRAAWRQRRADPASGVVNVGEVYYPPRHSPSEVAAIVADGVVLGSKGGDA